MQDRLRPATLAALCLTEFAVLAALTVPAVVGLQLRVARFHDGLSPESRLSWVTTTGAVAAILATPFFGWLSDRRIRRTGHRGPWLLGGAVVGCTAIQAAAQAPDLPLLVLAWAAAQAGYGATFAALFGTLSDLVPRADRARVSGLFAASGIASVAIGGGFAALLLSGRLGSFGTSTTVFTAFAWLSVPVAVLATWHLRGYATSTLASVQVPLGSPVGSPVGNQHGSVREGLLALAGAGPAFWWLLLQRVLVQASYVCLTVYAVFFLVRRMGEKPHDAATLVAGITAIGGLVAMVVAAGAARMLARQIGYRAAMGSGVALLLVANLLLAMATERPAYVVAHLCAGAGLGTYLALDLVVAMTLVPAGVAGRVLGYFNVIRKLPQALVPSLGPAVLAIGAGDVTGADRSQNYFALFVAGSLLALVALALTGRLVVPDRREASEMHVTGAH
ncbi:MAG: MFS transporter [Nocardioidaceae bacterium]|nr:MFS transporter [Nocardioidaceae bacterium]